MAQAVIPIEASEEEQQQLISKCSQDKRLILGLKTKMQCLLTVKTRMCSMRDRDRLMMKDSIKTARSTSTDSLVTTSKMIICIKIKKVRCLTLNRICSNKRVSTTSTCSSIITTLTETIWRETSKLIKDMMTTQ